MFEEEDEDVVFAVGKTDGALGKIVPDNFPFCMSCLWMLVGRSSGGVVVRILASWSVVWAMMGGTD